LGRFPICHALPHPADDPYVAFYVAFYVTPQKRTLAATTEQKDSNRSRKTGTMARLNVKVVPGSSRNRIVGWVGDALKIKVTAPPEASVPTTSRSSAVARHRPR
jgi:hypothetical protein